MTKIAIAVQKSVACRCRIAKRAARPTGQANGKHSKRTAKKKKSNQRKRERRNMKPERKTQKKLRGEKKNPPLSLLVLANPYSHHTPFFSISPRLCFSAVSTINQLADLPPVAETHIL